MMAWCSFCLTTQNGWAGVIEAGDFLDHVETLRNLTFESNSGLYVAPTAVQQSAFSAAAGSLLSGNLALAETQAAALDYEIVEFTDNASGDVYHGLRELNNSPTRGWGSFYVDLDATREALIEVPHPRFDTNSWDVAARAYQESDSRGFLMAGAHRNANGQGTADVAHLDESIFQEVHEAWNGTEGERTAWSIHGFDADKHSFPAGTDAVLSNGDGSISSEVVALDSELTEEGFLSFAYNTLDQDDPLNVAVNGSETGTTFSSLGGTTNVQGIHSRSLDGVFVHVELEQSIRFDGDNRIAAAGAISDAISAPEPSTVVMAFGLSIAVVFVHWRRKNGTSTKWFRGQNALILRCHGRVALLACKQWCCGSHGQQVGRATQET